METFENVQFHQTNVYHLVCLLDASIHIVRDIPLIFPVEHYVLGSFSYHELEQHVGNLLQDSI